MRFLQIAVFAIAALMPLAAQAETFKTPEALLHKIYDGYVSGDGFAGVSVYDMSLYSKRLRTLFESAMEGVDEGEMGPIDFDPFSNSQDPQLSDITIGNPKAGQNGMVSVDVSFMNGVRYDQQYLMVKEGGSWRIDDIVFKHEDSADDWRFSTVFEEYEQLN